MSFVELVFLKPVSLESGRSLLNQLCLPIQENHCKFPRVSFHCAKKMILALRVLFPGREELKSAPESCFTHFQILGFSCSNLPLFPSYIEVTGLLDEALDIA